MKHKINIAFDYDGVITANYQYYFQLAKDFVKNGHKIWILTAAKPERTITIAQELFDLHFPYFRISMRPSNFVSTHKNIGEYKKHFVKFHHINMWWDNEIKTYEQAGVDFSDLDCEIMKV